MKLNIIAENKHSLTLTNFIGYRQKGKKKTLQDNKRKKERGFLGN